MDRLPFVLGSLTAVPTEVRHWAENLKTAPGVYVTSYRGRPVILLAAGERPTGGYRVTVSVSPDHSTVYYSVQAPGRDDFVIQVITYPYELLFPEPGYLPRFVFKHGRKQQEIAPGFTPIPGQDE